MSSTTMTRPAQSPTARASDPEAVPATTRPHRLLAALRITLGLVFLWAFLDKTFALGFTTGRAEDGSVALLGPDAWINGASPTAGFLAHAPEGPLAPLFNAMAGQPIVDWLFMLGMGGVGLAFVLGIGLRIGALAGAILMLAIRATAPVPEHNPIVDDHLIYALALPALAALRAGDAWGLGERWRRTSLVQRAPWLA